MEIQERAMEEDINNMEVSLLNPMAFYPNFPHIGEQIFEKMDKGGLKTCRLLSKSWLEYMDNRNLLWKKIVEDEKNPKKSFRKAYKTYTG